MKNTMFLVIALAGLTQGCATPNVPYIRESKMTELSRHWASTTATGEKSLTIYNPLDQDVHVVATCNGFPSNFDVVVKAHNEYFAFVTVPQRYMIDRACFFETVDGVVVTEEK
jgi:hypothetical protein